MRPSEALEVEAALRRALARPARPSSDFDLNPGLPRLPRLLPEGSAERPLRPAAVLVGVDLAGAEARVLLTKRSAHLRHHPGQIALPGGKVDAGDADAAAAALREAREEVGLPPGAAEVIGQWGPHETVTGFSVTAVVALIREPFVPVPEAGEVEEVFFVPLAHVATAANFRVEGRRWGGHLRHYYAVPYGPYYVWGATARILRALADRMEA